MKVRIYARTTGRGAGNVYETLEIPDAKLAGLDDRERHEAVRKAVKNHVLDAMVEFGWDEIDEGD